MCDAKKVEAFKEKARALGIVPGLDNMRNLMEELGNIQEQLSVIHVAGTNGKGSTCAMLERILRLSGYRTGKYSSPAVFCEEEKYQINGVPILSDKLNRLFGELAEVCQRLTERGLPHPTIFEIETAAAFLWFYRQKCQVVILETGMGGTMDATNIIKKPLCSVITSISMDHMAMLGDTLTKIAGEKAGIIKEGRPVITARQHTPVYEVLRRVCGERHTDLIRSDTGEISGLCYEDGYLCFDWEEFRDLKLSLQGACQADNALCVIRTIYRLNGEGFCVGDDTIREGLRTTVCPGRFEILNRNPLLVIDGAHNEDAAKKLRKTLEMGFTNRKIIYIIGVLADKEHEKMLSVMLPLAEKVYTVTPDNPRALSGEELCREARRFHGNVRFAGSVREALEGAFRDAGWKQGGREAEGEDAGWETAKGGGRRQSEAGQEAPLILAFGSLSYLGQLKQEFLQIGSDRYGR